ncbi:MAG: response regulator, partial [Bacteroidetes bacterium]|nr:response regulator [Bacteroidota bacterium]
TLSHLEAQLTRRRQMEAALKRLSLVASANENGVVFTDPHGVIFWANEGFSRMTGFNAPEIIGKTPIEVCKGPLSDRQVLRQAINSFREGKTFSVEAILYRKDGSWFWGRAKGQAVLDDQGRVTQQFALIEDITSEKLALARINEFERKFRTAFEKIGDSCWELDFQTGKTYFSGSTGHQETKTADNGLPTPAEWWDRILSEDRRLLEERRRKYENGDIDHDAIEYRLQDSGEEAKWILDRSVVIERTQDGKPRKIIGTHTDISHIKRTKIELEQRVQQFQSLSENIPGVIFEFEFREDGTEGYRYISPALEKIFGIDPADFRSLSDYMRPEDRSHFERLQTESRNTLAPFYIESRLIVPTKGTYWCAASSSFSYYSNKGAKVFTGIIIDISAQKQLEKELIVAREQAEQFARSKDNFLANMSHEIRTPMNAVLGMAGQLAKTDLDEKQRFFLDTIYSASENLLVILNDILDLTKIRAGKLGLERIGFQPMDVFNRALQVMMHKAEEKGLLLHISYCDPGLSKVFIGDPYRLNQILLNLLSNAVKFTPKGSVDLCCKVLADHGNTQKIMIEVTDTGVGMEESFVHTLFDKFTQEYESVTRQYGGTGLGMSICKELITLMGGEIGVSSEKGIGTKVTVLIDFQKGSEIDLPSRDATHDMASLKNKKVLVVDDNDMNRLVATTILESYGTRIYEAANGKEAVEFLRHQSVDVVLMDIQMPVMSGLEASAVIRREIDDRLPIIALTANAIRGESEKCMAAGMNDYLSKPFDEKTLIKKISDCLIQRSDRLAIEAAIPSQADTPRTGERHGPLYDLRRLEEISNGNSSFVHKMIQLFVNQAPAAIAELKTACVAQDPQTVFQKAHFLKPMLHNFSIDSMQDDIRELEELALTGGPWKRIDEIVQTLSNVVTEVIVRLT